MTRPLRMANPVVGSPLTRVDGPLKVTGAARYAADRGPTIDVSWQGFAELGIWSKPGGAPFLCIEPWLGYADTAGKPTDFKQKEGIIRLNKGAEFKVLYSVEVG